MTPAGHDERRLPARNGGASSISSDTKVRRTPDMPPPARRDWARDLEQVARRRRAVGDVEAARLAEAWAAQARALDRRAAHDRRLLNGWRAAA